MYEELLNRINEYMTFLSDLNNDVVRKLYEEVNNYVKSNYLLIESDIYYIMYKGSIYAVGYFYGPSVLYYVRRAKNCECESFLNYEDVMKNKITEEEKSVKKELDSINDGIDSLKRKGISLDLIKKSIRF